MPPYSDVYVLARERSAVAAERFLDAFSPDREQSAKDYLFPQYGERPLTVVSSAAEAIRYCEAHPTGSQSLYFRNPGAGPAHAMLFFTPDGGLIFGLAVLEQEDVWLIRLKEHTGSEVGYINFESPPAATAAEFRELATSLA